MDERYLTIAAVLFEAGVPIVAALLLLRASKLRNYVVVVLGSVTPMLIIYAGIVIAYWVIPYNVDVQFAFYAGWVLSFILYAVSFILGIVLSLIPRPSNLIARYL